MEQWFDTAIYTQTDWPGGRTGPGAKSDVYNWLTRGSTRPEEWCLWLIHYITSLFSVGKPWVGCSGWWWCVCIVVGEKQREADTAGQVAAETAWKWTSSAHFLTDGSHAGHPCWVPSAPTLPFPGLLSSTTTAAAAAAAAAADSGANAGFNHLLAALLQNCRR